MLAPWKKSYDQPRQHIQKQRHYFANKGPSSKSFGFSIAMYGYDSWTIRKAEPQKNWCFQTVVLEKISESPLDSKEIKPVNPKGNQPWIFIGRTDAEAPILWPLWCEELIHWKRPWLWGRLRVGGESRDRGWDGWMASPIQWTWVWANSER